MSTSITCGQSSAGSYSNSPYAVDKGCLFYCLLIAAITVAAFVLQKPQIPVAPPTPQPHTQVYVEEEHHEGMISNSYNQAFPLVIPHWVEAIKKKGWEQADLVSPSIPIYF